MLPGYPKQINENVPLVNHGGRILTVDSNSSIVAFDTSLSDWTRIAEPPGKLTCIGVNDNTLYAYSKKLKRTAYSRITQVRSYSCVSRVTFEEDYEHENTLFSLATDTWKEHDQTSQGSDFKHLFISGHFFEVGSKIYCYKIEKTLEAESESTPKEQPKEIALPPYRGFSLHVIKDALFSFGGMDRDNQPTSDVLRYNLDTDTWESAGYMRSARYNVAVTTMQQGDATEVYVLGGELGSSELIMKPKLNIKKQETVKLKSTKEAVAEEKPSNWCCSTSMIEKCTLFN